MQKLMSDLAPTLTTWIVGKESAESKGANFKLPCAVSVKRNNRENVYESGVRTPVILKPLAQCQIKCLAVS
jgi:hypothetical protein